MFARATAPDFRLFPARTARFRSARYSYLRRDPRRFGQARIWLDDVSPAAEGEPSNHLRLFAHSFAGFFVFFSLLIA